MKFLSIVRHAKAAPPDESGADYPRPLAPRGHKDLKSIVRVLRKFDPPVDLILSSPARRAQETAERIAHELALSELVLWEERIYEATVDTLLDVLQQAPESAEHLVLIGHNPGLEELVSGLVAGTPYRLNMHLATGAVAHLQLEIFRWKQVRPGCGQLQLLIKPKFLKRKNK